MESIAGTKPDGQITCDIMERYAEKTGRRSGNASKEYHPRWVLEEISRIVPFFAGVKWDDATGTFCGATLTGKPYSRLFTCDTGYSTAVSTCSGGCSGSPATCAAPTGGGGTSPSLANPCEKADQGAGPYCGAALGLPAGSAEANTLYSCQKDPSSGKWISPFTSCPKGCQDGGPGAPDRCI